MRRRAFAMGLFLTVLGVAVPGVAPHAQVTITDLTPARPVYPKGPTVKVANPGRLADLHAWVVQHLDTVVVKRYKMPADALWDQDLQVAMPGDKLPTRVTGKDTPVPFALVIVDEKGMVRANRTFDVRVTPPDPGGWSWSLPWPWRWPGTRGSRPGPGWRRPLAGASDEAPFAASGQVTAIESISDMSITRSTGATEKVMSKVTLKDLQGYSQDFYVTDRTSQGWLEATEEPPTYAPGNTIKAIAYTGKQGDVIERLWPTMAVGPNPWADHDFYIGTVRQASSPKADEVVVDTVPAVNRKWIIRASTAILGGKASRAEAFVVGQVVAMGVKPGRPPASLVLVDRVIVLGEPAAFR